MVESLRVKAAVVPCAHSVSSVVAIVKVLLEVARTPEVELAIAIFHLVTDTSHDHGASLLNGNVPDIFSRLHKRQSSSEGLARILLQMHHVSVLLAHVVA